MAAGPAPPRTPRNSAPDPSRTPRADARAVAMKALGRVWAGQATLEAALAGAPGHGALEARDRAFARLLAATALRRSGEIDAVLAKLIERPLPQSAAEARAILALGIVQLLYLDTPPHAAVATAVALAETPRARKFKGLINAVLRRAAREGKALIAGLDAPRIDTPDWLWRAWCAAYGDAIARAIAAMHRDEPPLDLCPRRAADAPAIAEAVGGRVLPGGAVRRDGGGAIAELPGYADGSWWVQDAAAQVPARLLGDVAGKRVADLCAAPGGKTLQLAAAGAAVTAIDQSRARLDLIAANLKRAGLAAELVEADARTYDAPAFDAVLLDAPCSATGTMRRHPDIAWARRESDIANATKRQDQLLDAAARLTAPGGRLVYAVCSLLPAEGEDRIAAFLARHLDYALEPLAANELPGLVDALTTAGCFRSHPAMWAELGGLDGFFAARLRRSGEAGT